MELTLDLNDDLVARLAPHEHQISRIIDVGLREFNASSQVGFKGLAEVLEVLASLPAPEEVLALRPAPVLEERVQALLEKNRSEGLSPDEEREWERYEYLEHLVRMAKARAKAKLKISERRPPGGRRSDSCCSTLADGSWKGDCS